MTFLGQNTNNTGYTNHWLEERDHKKTFTQHYKDYKLIEEAPTSCRNDIANDIIKNIQETNPLAQAFFSRDNINHLQDLIIQIIYKRSRGAWKISRQSDNELAVIMRSIYLQKAQHIENDVIGEVADLNKQVLLYAVPKISSKIEQNLGYQRDRSATYDPFTRGELASNAGTKTTKGFTSVFI
jgi:tetrahydromethanopterin S-methyltransferase subunit B